MSWLRCSVSCVFRVRYLVLIKMSFEFCIHSQVMIKMFCELGVQGGISSPSVCTVRSAPWCFVMLTYDILQMGWADPAPPPPPSTHQFCPHCQVCSLMFCPWQILQTGWADPPSSARTAPSAPWCSLTEADCSATASRPTEPSASSGGPAPSAPCTSGRPASWTSTSWPSTCTSNLTPAPPAARTSPTSATSTPTWPCTQVRRTNRVDG